MHRRAKATQNYAFFFFSARESDIFLKYFTQLKVVAFPIEKTIGHHLKYHIIIHDILGTLGGYYDGHLLLERPQYWKVSVVLVLGFD